MACGRALLAWGVPEALRAPVLRQLDWRIDERHYDAFDAHAAWARHALQAIADDAAPPSRDEVIGVADEVFDDYEFNS